MISSVPFGKETAATKTELEIEWTDVEVVEAVSGHRVGLSRAVDVDLLKVEATPKPPTDYKFQNDFGDKELTVAGFGSHVPFEDRLHVIRGAFKGDLLMSVTLNADGSDALNLNIDVPITDFSVKYTLPLARVLLTEDHSATAARIKFEQLAVTTTATELKEDVSVDFRFDGTTQSGYTQPRGFQLSADRKTATKVSGYSDQILLDTKLPKGKCSFKFLIAEKNGPITVGLLQDCSQYIDYGCAFHCDGDVYINYSKKATASSFGGWQKGDCIKVTTELNCGKVSISSPYGETTFEFTPTAPVSFVLSAPRKGTTVTLL